MRIAIVAHTCRAGGGLYGTLNLLRPLKHIAPDDQIFLIATAGLGYEAIDLPTGSEIYLYRGNHLSKRIYFERFALPELIKKWQPDVIFGTGNTGLIHPTAPQALFFRQAHLVYASSEHKSSVSIKLRLRLIELRQQIRASLPHTDIVFSQTPVVRKRFSKEFNFPENRMPILRFSPPVDIEPEISEPTPSTIGNPEKSFHVLLLTRYLPHRNPDILIRVCHKYGNILQREHIRFIITLNPSDPPAARFLSLIHKYKLEDIIINAGELNRKQVIQYMLHCDLLWMPTTLETLCIPLLEAMKMKLPIFVPDFDFSRYVCGNAAVFHNFFNIEDTFEKLMILRTNNTLRQELISQGLTELDNRSKFAASWKDVIKDALFYLRQLIE